MSEDRRDDYTAILERIADQVTDQGKLLTKLDKKVDLNIQKMEYELSNIHQTDMVQNKLIEEHIAGVNTLQGIYEEHKKENNARFETLEAPRKWFKTTKNIILVLGSLAAATLGILKLFSVF